HEEKHWRQDKTGRDYENPRRQRKLWKVKSCQLQISPNAPPLLRRNYCLDPVGHTKVLLRQKQEVLQLPLNLLKDHFGLGSWPERRAGHTFPPGELIRGIVIASGGSRQI